MSAVPPMGNHWTTLIAPNLVLGALHSSSYVLKSRGRIRGRQSLRQCGLPPRCRIPDGMAGKRPCVVESWKTKAESAVQAVGGDVRRGQIAPYIEHDGCILLEITNTPRRSSKEVISFGVGC